MSYNPVVIKEKFSQIREHWSPKVVAKLNDYHFKIAKVEGEFIWHSHPETDEAFFIVDGQLKILFRDGEVVLNKGDLFVVKKGVEHKPVAEKECHILMIEPEGTVNTGDAGGDRTKNADWI